MKKIIFALMLILSITLVNATIILEQNDYSRFACYNTTNSLVDSTGSITCYDSADNTEIAEGFDIHDSEDYPGHPFEPVSTSAAPSPPPTLTVE